MDDLRNSDFEYFVQNYMDLYREYGHKFIAIKNKKVLGTYDDVMTAIKTTMETEELGSFIVQECTGDPSAYTCNIATLCVV